MSPPLDFRQGFRVNPDVPVDALLKKGIFRTFELLLRRYPCEVPEIRFATVNALDILSKLNSTLTEQHKWLKKEKLKRGFAFFSSLHNCLIEYVAQGPGKVKLQVHEIEEVQTTDQKLFRKQQANVAFKTAFLKIVGSYSDTAVEKIFLQGAIFVLQKAEDFASPAVEVFRQQQPLFSALRDVYENSELSTLDSSKGNYNQALTAKVPFTMKQRERDNKVVKKEEGVFFHEG